MKVLAGPRRPLALLLVVLLGLAAAGCMPADARTFLDRGILYSGLERADAASLAEADFREAISLLEPLAGDGGAPGPRQELSRALNNLGNLMLVPGQPLQEAEQLYTRTVQTHEALVAGEPTNREYRMELAQFYNNLI